MTKKISSIYYFPVPPIERPLYNGLFKLEPVKKGAPPFILTVKDHIQMETLPWFKGTTPAGRQRQERITILGEDIVRDLMTHWTEHAPGMSPDCRPGIWIVRDTVALFDESGKPIMDAEGIQETRQANKQEYDAMFAEDLAANTEYQDNWVHKSIAKGNLMSDDPKKIEWIPSYCKAAAEYRGETPMWLKRPDVMSCPFCKRPVMVGTSKCGHCGDIIDQKLYSEMKEVVKRLGQQDMPKQPAA